MFIQDVNPGAFAAGITLLTGVPEVIISCVKAALFGLIAGLVACYRGLDDHRRRREGRRQRRQRDRGVRVHGAVRDQRARHRHRHPDDDEVMGDDDGAEATYPRLFRGSASGRSTCFGSIGDHILFYGKALAGIPHAAVHFRKEIIRLIAEITMGAGTLAMIGGTVVIVGFLTLAAGGTLAVQGYSSLGNIGIEALTGFLAGVHQRAHRGTGRRGHRPGGHLRRGRDRAAGRDADQRGDRRAGVDGASARSSTWCSTRIIAGMIAITPLYSIAVILSFVASQFTTVVLFGQSGGLYDHYFNTFLNPIDLLWSFLQAVLMAITILLIHTYLRLFRHRRALRCRRRGGQRGAHLADRRRLGDPAGLPVHLRRQRQLQPVGIGDTTSMKRSAVRPLAGLGLFVALVADLRARDRPVPRQLHRNRSGDGHFGSRRPGDEPRRQGEDARRAGRQGRPSSRTGPTARPSCTWRWTPTQLHLIPVQRRSSTSRRTRCSARSSSS